MNNKGRIVVFMSMITGVFLLLILVVLQVVVHSNAKSKTVIAARLSMSDIKACYNSYIFEHYHILLFDKAKGGEAGLEEQLAAWFSEKLGTGYTDVQVAVTQVPMLSDRSYEAFQTQMREHAAYALAEDGVEAIREKTGGQDGALPEDLKDAMEDAQETQETETSRETEPEMRETDAGSTTQTAEEQEAAQEAVSALETVEDPRDYTKTLSDSAILNLVLPGDKQVSDAWMEQRELPSQGMPGFLSDYSTVDREFDAMNSMLISLQTLGSWQDALVDTGSQSLYAAEVFNSYLEEKNETAVLRYEQEYLIAGKNADAENLKSVAHRMIGIRFPINYISLCGQTDKMAKLTTIASSIAAAAPYLIPALKYLLAGCWAYIESIADVRILFDGKKAAFVKTSQNWITDIEHISDSLSKETENTEDGLDYQAYLTILQLMKPEVARLRMLDLIQINAMQEDADFRIRNAAVGIKADFSCSYDGQVYRFHLEDTY